MRWRKESILDVYKLALGCILFASPWMVAATHGVMGHEAWIAGAIAVAVSLAALIVFADWEEWLLLVLGVWLVISPLVLGFENTKAVTINVGLGFVIAYLAAMELFLIHYPESSRPQH
jgi:hypothetical protein